MSRPSVAVVIPVHEDRAGLVATLEALRDAHGGATAVQVVVAVDGRAPDIAATARGYGADVIETTSRGGSYAARVAALTVVAPDVDAVLFTDADCLPRPGWVEAHLRTLESADLSGGAVEFALSRPVRPAEWVDSHRHLQQQRYVENEGFAATCNLGVRRQVLDVVAFRTDLWSGGDAEFCRRATREGFTLRYSPDAVVVHPARRTWGAVLAKVRRVAAGVAQQPGTATSGARGDDGRDLVRLARRDGVSSGLRWEVAVRALDLLCSTEYARRTGQLGAQVRRRLGAGR